MSLTYRGVNYDTGTNYGAGGALSRHVWRPELVRLEIQAIRNELHCDSIGIFGTDLDRLVQAATIAREHGLHVWLQPRLVDADRQRMLDHLAEAAGAAEELRRQHSAVTLNVGCELTIFSAGIIPGATYQERGARLASPRTWPLLPWYNRRLNSLLARAATVARSSFQGRLTYGAGLWEQVDWRPFDIVGLDYYRVRFNRRRYAANLRRHLRHGKPVVVVEFGCASFADAVEKGPAAHEIIDWSGDVPQVGGGHQRNEEVQAEQLGELIDIYEAAGVDGAFVFEFIEPSHPHSDDPRRDLDMAGYGIVKVLPGQEPETYRWEPKAAFHTVAQRYAAGD
ncbi:abortive infection protein [Plantactinospora solaniradicis]|uniref:Abortive infection protein n=1 Tax=Plantactinospora solaniradicis TaxID=1723736 RepID=A0ABW1K4F4_9ACTN